MSSFKLFYFMLVLIFVSSIAFTTSSFAQCTIGPTGGSSASGRTDFGQSFIPCQTGNISSITVKLLSSESDCTLNIRQGEGYGTADYSQTGIAIAGETTISLTSDFNVAAGLTYTFWVTGDGTMAIWTNSNVYPDGRYFFNGGNSSVGNDLNFSLDITGSAPQTAIPNPSAPADGETQTFSENGTVATVAWNAGTGSVPADLELTYQAGTQYSNLPQGTTALSRVWSFDASGGSPVWIATVRLYYDQGEVGAVTENTMEVWKTDDNGSSWIAATITNRDVNNDWIEVEVSSFSDFVITDDSTPLPVELDEFYAEVVKEGIMLHWKTSAEIDNKGFYVYRNDARISNLISGQGTTNELHEYTFLDKNVVADHAYSYHISDIKEGTNNETHHSEITIIYDEDALGQTQTVPTVYALHNAYPNPFNPKTTIQFDLPFASLVNLRIYDASGKLIKTLVDSDQEADFHSVEWNGTDENGSTVSSGLYFYRLDAKDHFSQTKSIVLLK